MHDAAGKVACLLVHTDQTCNQVLSIPAVCLVCAASLHSQQWQHVLNMQELQGLKHPPAAAVTTPTDTTYQGLLVTDVDAQSQVQHPRQGV